MVLFGFIWFYGISTLVGHLMPYPLYTHIQNIHDLLKDLVDNIFKWDQAHSFEHIKTVSRFLWRIIIIIIMSHHQHGYPWPFLTPLLYNPLLLASIGTELSYVGSSWSSCFCSSMCRGPREYVTYEFVLTSPAVSHMSGSLNLESFCDGWFVGRCLQDLFNIARSILV